MLFVLLQLLKQLIELSLGKIQLTNLAEDPIVSSLGPTNSEG